MLLAIHLNGKTFLIASRGVSKDLVWYDVSPTGDALGKLI
jgi:hypothetical protein